MLTLLTSQIITKVYLGNTRTSIRYQGSDQNKYSKEVLLRKNLCSKGNSYHKCEIDLMTLSLTV